jgi:membrane protein
MSTLKELFVRIGQARTLGLAAEMAFWLFLALVPLAVVAGLVAARFTMQDPSGAASAVLSSMPTAARDLLRSELGKIDAANGAVAPTAVVVFLWLASSGVHAVFDAFEIEAGCTRPWWLKRLIALGTCIVLSIGIALVTLLGTGLEWIWRLTGARVPEAAWVAESSMVGQVVRFVIGALVAFGLTCLVFVFGVPREGRSKMPILPGAILAVLLDSILGLGYAFYISKAGTGSAYQAGLATVGVTMMAIYLSSLALLVGLELNVVLRDRPQRYGGGSRSSPRAEPTSSRDAERRRDAIARRA